MAKTGKNNIAPNRDMIRNFTIRFGYVPIAESLAEIIGCSWESIAYKINQSNFQDKEKILIAKEFELTAQEFVDMFYPGYFHEDGNIKLDREVKYKQVQRERNFNIFPRYR